MMKMLIRDKRVQKCETTRACYNFVRIYSRIPVMTELARTGPPLTPLLAYPHCRIISGQAAVTVSARASNELSRRLSEYFTITITVGYELMPIQQMQCLLMNVLNVKVGTFNQKNAIYCHIRGHLRDCKTSHNLREGSFEAGGVQPRSCSKWDSIF